MRRPVSQPVLAALCAGLLALGGCGKFFTPETGGGGCTTNCTTANHLYVANQKVGGAEIAGFSVASATLSAVPNSPFALTVLPTALAINPANTFLYAGSADGLVFLYAISGDGSLTVQNGGRAVANIAAASLQVDTTGAWLLVANAAAATVSVFSIDTTTGILAAPTAVPATVTLNGGVGIPSHLAITPAGTFVYVSLGTGGVEVLSFSSTDGTLTDTGHLATKGGQNSDQGLAVNPTSTFLFVTETGVSAVRVLSISATGSLTEVAGSPFATGLGPTGVLVDATGSYLYVTNRTDNTISGFLLTNSGSLTAIAGSPFATGTTPVAIAEDTTKTYIAVVCEGGVPDLQLYTLDATTAGKLDKFANATTGTDPTIPVAIAATH